jgi:hypothetical protein
VGKLPAEAPAQEDELRKQFCLASTNGLHVSTLIATVPNPELTHLSLSFDRYVESITWALDDGDLDKESYSFDSYWFPWRTDLKDETDVEKRKAAELEREKRSNTPGILVFRRNPQQRGADNRASERDLLLVFLVGETPTSGINRAAFEKAWTYATKLGDTELPVCHNAKPCVAIVGPSFTGSLPSLKLLLEGASATGYESFVISGAVTGDDPSTRNLPAKAHFCTTIETDANRWQVLQQLLTSLSKWAFWESGGEPLKHFAILGEDETEYGNLQRVVGGKDLLALRFPRGIARVRNSADSLPGLVKAAGDTGYPELPLVLRDTGQDTLPGFSQQQTPVSQEAVLLELIATLRREGIRYVGIVATDPLDALFLTRALHSLAPNIRIVLFSADLLFARASHTWGLSGVLAVTSYPLISRNQYYEGVVYPRRTQFANDAAEGVYNASRRMLLRAPENSNTQPCSAANQIVKGDSAKQDYLLDYAPPFALPNHSHKPSVWLTILGRNEWWPVAAATANGQSRLLEGPAPPSHDTEHFSVEASPRPWSMFFWLIWTACTMHVALVYSLNLAHRKTVRWWKYSSLRRLAWRYKRELELRRRITLAGASFTVALVYCADGCDPDEQREGLGILSACGCGSDGGGRDRARAVDDLGHQGIKLQDFLALSGRGGGDGGDSGHRLRGTCRFGRTRARIHRIPRGAHRERRIAGVARDRAAGRHLSVLLAPALAPANLRGAPRPTTAGRRSEGVSGLEDSRHRRAAAGTGAMDGDSYRGTCVVGFLSSAEGAFHDRRQLLRSGTVGPFLRRDPHARDGAGSIPGDLACFAKVASGPGAASPAIRVHAAAEEL